MESIWKLGGLTWIELAKRVWKEIGEDNVFGRAAELAYYFILSLFPMLIFLISLLGYFAGSGEALRDKLFTYLSAVMPASSSEMIHNILTEVTQANSGAKISVGLFAALWAASSGLSAIIGALNVTYEVEESRPWWKVRLIAVGLTVALASLIILALIIILYGGSIAESITSIFGLSNLFETTWKVLQWPLALFFVLIAFALIYYWAPSVKEQRWYWVTPGALIGVGLWLLASFGFRFYLEYFDSYSKTYGSLGAVIILLLWLYITGAAIMLGGEINSEIEHAAAKKGAPDAKEKGEKQPQENDAKAEKVEAA